MFQKCSGCGQRLITAGEKMGTHSFCNQNCKTAFLITVGAQLVKPEEIETRTLETFNSPCPTCKKPGPLEVYYATRVTGLLLAFHVETQPTLSCASCGRKGRLKAAAHCLLAGWWSPRAAIINIFVLPYNLIAAALVRPPREPSDDLRAVVRAELGAALLPTVLESLDDPPSTTNSRT